MLEQLIENYNTYNTLLEANNETSKIFYIIIVCLGVVSAIVILLHPLLVLNNHHIMVTVATILIFILYLISLTITQQKESKNVELTKTFIEENREDYLQIFEDIDNKEIKPTNEQKLILLKINEVYKKDGTDFKTINDTFK